MHFSTNHFILIFIGCIFIGLGLIFVNERSQAQTQLETWTKYEAQIDHWEYREWTERRNSGSGRHRTTHTVEFTAWCPHYILINEAKSSRLDSTLECFSGEQAPQIEKINIYYNPDNVQEHQTERFLKASTAEIPLIFLLLFPIVGAMLILGAIVSIIINIIRK